MDMKLASPCETETIRLKYLLHKVNIYQWCIRRDFLPCYMNLATRGVNIPSLLCPLCKTEVENIEHALFRCSKVFSLWESVARWCNVSGLLLWQVTDLTSPETLNLVSAESKEIWQSILLVTCWCIWRARNGVIKEDKVWSHLQIFSDVQALSHLWLSSQKPSLLPKWPFWLLNPCPAD